MQCRTEQRGVVGIMWISNPPVNAINVGVRRAIIEFVTSLDANAELRAGVLACEGGSFMTGADITEFGKPSIAPSLQDVIRALENAGKPIIAALHGTAFGGGLEVALACHYRLAVLGTRIGLPEVKLGLLPGAGGTQRLPRLAGVERALEIIVSGESVDAKCAADVGIIDRVVVAGAAASAVTYAEQLILEQAPLRRVRDISIDALDLPADFFEQTRKRITKKYRGISAPQRIVDALEAATQLPFEDGLNIERTLFLQCMAGGQAKALQHVFFAERKASKIPSLANNVARRDIRRVAVIGAGTMGGGITMNFLNAVVPVTLLDASQEALDHGIGVVRKNYESSAARGRLTHQQLTERMELLRPTLDYSDLRDADLIIEAVFETLTVKREVFYKVDAAAKPGAILASNTSYLSIDDIARATRRPADVLGMHFFSPANQMRLIEIVRGKMTSREVLATVMDLTKRIKKVGVVCGNRDGFIGNRMLAGYAYQALLIGLHGQEPTKVDAALRSFGFPIGIYQMGDLAGLDVGYRSRQDRDPNSFDVRVTRTADKLVEMGRLGQKTCAGYYDYLQDDRTPKPSALVKRIMSQSSKEFSFSPREFSEEEIIERCLLGLVNAGCEILREGVATRASDIDVVYVNGYGFPAHHGGPMFWAEHEFGLGKALEKLTRLSEEQGARWLAVSPLLQKLVAEGRGFDSIRLP